MGAALQQTSASYMAADRAFSKPCRPWDRASLKADIMFAGSTTAKIGDGRHKAVFARTLQRPLLGSPTDKYFAEADSKTIRRELRARRLARRGYDVQSIQRIRKWCELKHRCRFRLAVRGLVCRSATLSALNLAFSTASRGAKPSSPAAIRARFDA